MTKPVLLAETRGLCASISGVPSAEGLEIGKRRGPRLGGRDPFLLELALREST